MKYRMYVDEVGNSDLGSSEDPNHRYLSLTGVILELEYVRNHFFGAVEELKRRYFGSHPDEPIIFEEGTGYVVAEGLSQRLTSCELKVKLKSNNIAGLQLADPIAHPSYIAVRTEQTKTGMPGIFGAQIADILRESKYDRSALGRISGWGTKWLP